MASLQQRLHAKHGASAIVRFDGANAFLSNFTVVPKFVVDGFEFKTSEAAFQSLKVSDITKRAAFTSLTPKEAKRAGQSLLDTPGWFGDVRVEAMKKVLAAKVSLLRQGDSDSDSLPGDSEQWSHHLFHPLSSRLGAT